MYQALFFPLSSQRNKEAKKKKPDLRLTVVGQYSILLSEGRQDQQGLQDILCLVRASRFIEWKTRAIRNRNMALGGEIKFAFVQSTLMTVKTKGLQIPRTIKKLFSIQGLNVSRSVTNDLDVVHIWLFDSEISRKLVLWLNLAFQ